MITTQTFVGKQKALRRITITMKCALRMGQRYGLLSPANPLEVTEAILLFWKKDV